MQTPPVNTRDFISLVEVVKALRGPDGCPWDKEQTHKTLTQYAIEEAHELAEAIDRDSRAEIIEELGDLLLQVVLHAEIARQDDYFTLEDVVQGITEKMVRRHPHVFGDVKVKDSGQVLANWAKLKEAEKATADSVANSGSETKSAVSPFASIPLTLPALIRSQKIGAKTVRFNFDWEKPTDVIAKIEEELSELKEAVSSGSGTQQQEELGDLLFSVVQLARHLNIDAEQSLRITNQKFENRFLKMRELVELDSRDFTQLSVKELENYWQKAKMQLKTK